MKRREFLTGLLAIGALGSLPVGAREQKSPRRLVAIHLFGGNDGLNTIVPAGDRLYRKARPGLALNSSQLLPLQSGLGMHEALKPLHGLWEKKQLAIVQGVGYEHPNRSHFQSADIWHGAGAHTPDGWLGRLAAREHWDVVQVDQQTLSRALWMPPQSAGVPVCVHPGQDVQDPLPADLANTLHDLYGKSSLAPTYRKWRQVQEKLHACPGETFRGTELRQSLKAILELWSLGRIFHASVGGFDTHGDQRNRQARVLGEVALALGEFYTELERRGWARDTTILIYSEFGRRVEENASGGTDHGGAGPVLLLGGRVKGGLYGEHPSLADLADGGDLRHGFDFRQVYASILEGWLETDSRAVLGGQYGTIPCWA